MTTSTDKPIIGVILGDAAGIGPELVAKIAADGFLARECRPFLIGDKRVLEAGMKTANVSFPVTVVESPEDADFDAGINILDMKNLDPAAVPVGQVDGRNGKAVAEAMLKAIDLIRDGHIHGMTFAPLNKTAFKKGGYAYESEIMLFKDYLGVQNPVGEINVLDGLMTSRVTSHVPLMRVGELLTEDSILAAINLINDASRRSGVARPRVGVAALNPHAGENGTCGREEIDVIAPAVEKARAAGIDATGPYSSDILFVKAFKGEFDAAVTMFHDQGQIAMKLKGFDFGVTMSGGIPIPVTTPAHGTAYDIAGKNIAQTEAIKNAVRLVVKLASNA